MPVLENHSKFLLPAKYDELLTIEVTLPKLPGVKIEFFYRIFNEQEELIHTGSTLLAFVRTDNGRPCRPPQIMLDLFKPFFNEE